MIFNISNHKGNANQNCEIPLHIRGAILKTEEINKCCKDMEQREH